MDITLILFVIVFGIGLILLVFTSPATKVRQKKVDALKQEFYSHAKSIKSASRGELRDMVVKMDKTLADTLRFHFNNSDTIGENLKSLRGKYDKSLMDKIWKYHKIRNRVVHDSVDVRADTVYAMYNSYLVLINKII
jgi:hypothetical protein